MATLSKNGFTIGFVLTISSMTLHDLRNTMIFKGVAGEDRDRMLLEGLTDLCSKRLLVWSFEPDYGNKPHVEPPDYSDESLLKYWREFIAKSDLSAKVPDRQNPTLWLEGTPALCEEVEKEDYAEWDREINW